MALKGQKFIRFTDEERTEIVGKYLSGKYSYATLADEYGISWNIQIISNSIYINHNMVQFYLC